MPKLKNTIELHVEKYKGVKQLQVVLEPGASIFGGKNAAGKSSVLDAMANAFGGKRLSPPKPVREGEQEYKCSVTLTKMGLKIVRTGKIGEDGKLREKLTVEDAEGFKASSPQELLERLLDGHSIRPRAFSEMKATEQIAMLKQVAGLDWAELDAEYGKLYEERRDANVRLKATAAQLDGMPIAESTLGPVDLPALRKGITTAYETNTAVDGIEKDLGAAQERLAASQEKVEGLEAQLQAANVERMALAKTEKSLKTKLSKMARIDVKELQAGIERAEEIDAAVQIQQQREEIAEMLAVEQAESNKLDDRMRAIRATKEIELGKAKIPVKGLTLGDEGVYLKGIPFEQASQSERLEVSLRMGLALHPKVPIVLVHEGSLFDEEHLQAIDAVAKEHDAFVLVEKVMDKPSDRIKVFMVAGTGTEVQNAGKGSA